MIKSIPTRKTSVQIFKNKKRGRAKRKSSKNLNVLCLFTFLKTLWFYDARNIF